MILIRGRSLDDALRRGDREAKAYARNRADHVNPFGQLVTLEYLSVADAFQFFEEPDAGVEVYSSTALVPSSRSVVDAGERQADRIDLEVTGICG